MNLLAALPRPAALRGRHPHASEPIQSAATVTTTTLLLVQRAESSLPAAHSMEEVAHVPSIKSGSANYVCARTRKRTLAQADRQTPHDLACSCFACLLL